MISLPRKGEAGCRKFLAALAVVVGTGACLASAPLVGARAQTVEGPPILTSIPPVQGLVSAVTSGVTLPDVLVPPEAEPHAVELDESIRAGMAAYSMFVWVGNELTFDPTAVGTPGPRVMTLWPEAPVTEEGEPMAVWLDPQNARRWVNEIADVLAESDPQNAAAYTSNARGFRARLDALAREIDLLMLLPVKDQTLVLEDRSLLPFTERFDLTVEVAEEGAAQVCQPDLSFAQEAIAVASDTSAQQDGTDIGAAVNPYLQGLRRLARQVAECLSGG